MLKTAGFCFAMLTAITAVTVRFVCYAFVDDADLVQAADTPETEWTVVKDKMQGQIDHWEGGLRATGGALREDKSFWYLIDYEWKKGKWEYKTIEDTPGDLTVRVDQGHREVIQRLEPHEAHEQWAYGSLWMVVPTGFQFSSHCCAASVP